mmetsp:Transcript_93051/g.299487  ORF Transcript_93051/g.299487 Transcript_93051/m.299487 type:complete len:208 (-) Transcript_93051:27-650(-)
MSVSRPITIAFPMINRAMKLWKRTSSSRSMPRCLIVRLPSWLSCKSSAGMSSLLLLLPFLEFNKLGFLTASSTSSSSSPSWSSTETRLYPANFECRRRSASVEPWESRCTAASAISVKRLEVPRTLDMARTFESMSVVVIFISVHSAGEGAQSRAESGRRACDIIWTLQRLPGAGGTRAALRAPRPRSRGRLARRSHATLLGKVPSG